MRGSCSCTRVSSLSSTTLRRTAFTDRSLPSIPYGETVCGIRSSLMITWQSLSLPLNSFLSYVSLSVLLRACVLYIPIFLSIRRISPFYHAIASYPPSPFVSHLIKIHDTLPSHPHLAIFPLLHFRRLPLHVSPLRNSLPPHNVLSPSSPSICYPFLHV